MTYLMFWGCHIPVRFPYLELSLKKVLDALGIKYAESERFTCCPENFGVKSIGHYPWLLTAGRNLAIAENMGMDIVSACNGCYSTLKSALAELCGDALMQRSLNQALQRIGMEYLGTVRVLHFIEMLYEDISPAGIKRRIRMPLQGLKIAVHPGCHLLRPSTHLRFDEPFIASKFDELIEATGAKSLKYNTKFLCCGGSFNYAGEEELSVQAVRMKLRELSELGADALVTGCPTCYSQFELGQMMLNRSGEKFEVPVLYYTEILGLALGMSAEELALDRHRIPADRLLSALSQREAERASVKGILNFEMMRECVACSACKDDCPAIKVSNENFQPHRIFEEILAGGLDDVLRSKEIWQCLDCYTCEEMCGQGIGMNRFFRQLREMALAKGLAPESVQGAVDAFRKTGSVTKPSQMLRKKLGLRELNPAGAEDLKRLLADYEDKKEQG